MQFMSKCTHHFLFVYSVCVRVMYSVEQCIPDFIYSVCSQVNAYLIHFRLFNVSVCV